MANIFDRINRDFKYTISNPKMFGVEINLVSPSGIRHSSLYGMASNVDLTTNISIMNTLNQPGEHEVLSKPAIALNIKDLTLTGIPKKGEEWFVEVKTIGSDGSFIPFITEGNPMLDSNTGMITLQLTSVKNKISESVVSGVYTLLGSSIDE